ncbi:MAG: hypothetical protein LBG83_01285 [Oscillospiraceae bacterium]|jgi:carboxyl-terminal processing protease|nr:hypothetical protein [Oscillospiraceae bacterium]
MSRKITLGAALALALLLVAASIPLTMLFATNSQNKLIDNLPARAEKYEAMDEVRSLVDTNFYERIDSDAVTAAMVQGYINGLGDQRSRYLTQDEYVAYQQRLSGERPEMGLELDYSPPPVDAKDDNKNGSVYVVDVKNGSPAAVSGLQVGDVILKADTGDHVLYEAKNLSPTNYNDQISKIMDVERSSSNTPSVSVNFTFQRNGTTQPPTNVMIGNSVSSLSSKLIHAADAVIDAPSQEVGYIKISYFMKNTADELDAAIKELSSKGASSYVIDLRGCSEGTIGYACAALDKLLPILAENQVMAEVRSKNTLEPKTYISDAYNDFSYATGGMALLINSATSGPAELFAYDLRLFYHDSLPADQLGKSPLILVGQATAGIHTVQEVFPLRRVEGAALLTVGTVVPYLGNADWARVEPTHPVGNEEMMLDQAIQALIPSSQKPQTAEEM